MKYNKGDTECLTCEEWHVDDGSECLQWKVKSGFTKHALNV